MRALATALLLLLGPASYLAEGRSELDTLRARCTEQERQIRTLEGEIESLHSQLALERRRSRGAEPSAAPAAPLTPANSAESAASYTVKTGDTLSSIARRYRTSAEALMKSNGITDPTKLRVGQKLTLPGDARTPKVTPPAQPSPAALVKNPTTKKSPPITPAPDAKSYQVQRGDTLYGIARRHDISVGALRTLNPKIEDKIVVGQTISVTGKNNSPSRTHTISTRTPKPPVSTPKAPPVKNSVAKKREVTKKPDLPKPPPVVKKKESPAPQPAPAVAKKEEAPKNKIFMPKTISSIFVTEEVSFGDFAKRHGTSPEQLNALNGWEFKSGLVLAKGSEIYVPGR